MIRNLFLFLILIIMTSCGGGGSGYESAIEGIWRGDLRQGVIVCTNGVATGAGAGSVIRYIELEVSGSDQLGSPVHAYDGTCYFEGVRDQTGFVADAISGCPAWVSSITFELLEDGTAAFDYDSDINLVPASEEGVRCTADEFANLER